MTLRSYAFYDFELKDIHRLGYWLYFSILAVLLMLF